jgi:hypothetical protein
MKKAAVTFASTFPLTGNAEGSHVTLELGTKERSLAQCRQ